MAECIRLAARGLGSVSPNPLVGAVLVKNGRIVATGYHRRFGGAHAEVDCLQRYRGDARGTTLYVNLEPCSITGKTPPCVDEIRRRGVRRVVVGMKDPNPKIAGRGIATLRRWGIATRVGVLQEECLSLNRQFSRSITIRRPYIMVKIASTLDGKIAGVGGTTIVISGKESRSLVHRWRAESDAVLVGAGTIRHDNPLLTVRLAKGRDPSVVILDGKLTINPRSRVVRSAKRRRVLVCASAEFVRKKPRTAKELLSRGVQILSFSAPSGILSLRKVLRSLYHEDVGSILVEGGGEVFQRFLASSLFDEMHLFVSPRIVGKGIDVPGAPASAGGFSRRRFSRLALRTIGQDALFSITV